MALNSGVLRNFAKAGSSFSHSVKRPGSLVFDLARRSASSVPLRSPSIALATARLPRAMWNPDQQRWPAQNNLSRDSHLFDLTAHFPFPWPGPTNLQERAL